MPFVYIVLGTLMWSLDTLIRYPLLGSVGFDTMVFIEHVFLVLYFVPLLFIHKFDFKTLNGSSLFSFFMIGVVGSAISTLAFTKAFSLINPSLVILLQKLQPVVAVSLSALLLNESISKKFFIYGFFALAGAFLVSYPNIAPLFQSDLQTGAQTAQESQAGLGYLFTLLAVVGWGASTVFGKKLSNLKFKEYEIMSRRFIFGFAFLLMYCLSQKSMPTGSVTIEIYLKILLMVFLSGLLGMYLYYKGLKNLPAHLGSVAELFFPLSAVTINWIFLGKTLAPVQIAGGAILVIASALLQRSQTKASV